MIITITIDIPEGELLKKLILEGYTRKQFSDVLTEEFQPLLKADELCTGATATFTIT